MEEKEDRDDKTVWHLQMHFYIWVKSVKKELKAVSIWEEEGTRKIVPEIFDLVKHWMFSPNSIYINKTGSTLYLKARRKIEFKNMKEVTKSL